MSESKQPTPDLLGSTGLAGLLAGSVALALRRRHRRRIEQLERVVVLEIKLPIPVKKLAVTDALAKLHGTGKLFMRQEGQMLQIFKPKP